MSETLTVDECTKALQTTIDSLPKQDAIAAIEEILARLNFELRWQKLAPNQRQHMCDESLSDCENEALKHCTTEDERDERFTMYARARYFRRCHWLMYLNGESDHPPMSAE